jgi:phosphinothricin acetyltransferase
MPDLADFHIRLARREDLDRIVEIYNSTIPSREVTADLEPVSVESRVPWFEAHQPVRHPLWVVELDGRVIGWASLSAFYGRPAYDGTAELSIYLDASVRGRGLGQRLLNYALEACPALGIRTVLGFIFAHNPASLALFERNGFARWANLPDVAELDGVRRSLIIVGKALDGTEFENRK